ncbi:MAG: hypothetical protein HON43_05855 [Alphaproteobacteria bacterium]|jgi:hypothetical protein|nr:hypothetical protein [Alphaproteobacteria bacterium]
MRSTKKAIFYTSLFMSTAVVMFPMSNAEAVNKVLREKEKLINGGATEEEAFKAVAAKFAANGGEQYISKWFPRPKAFTLLDAGSELFERAKESGFGNQVHAGEDMASILGFFEQHKLEGSNHWKFLDNYVTSAVEGDQLDFQQSVNDLMGPFANDEADETEQAVRGMLATLVNVKKKTVTPTLSEDGFGELVDIYAATLAEENPLPAQMYTDLETKYIEAYENDPTKLPFSPEDAVNFGEYVLEVEDPTAYNLQAKDRADHLSEILHTSVQRRISETFVSILKEFEAGVKTGSSFLSSVKFLKDVQYGVTYGDLLSGKSYTKFLDSVRETLELDPVLFGNGRLELLKTQLQAYIDNDAEDFALYKDSAVGFITALTDMADNLIQSKADQVTSQVNGVEADNGVEGVDPAFTADTMALLTWIHKVDPTHAIFENTVENPKLEELVEGPATYFDRRAGSDPVAKELARWFANQYIDSVVNGALEALELRDEDDAEEPNIEAGKVSFADVKAMAAEQEKLTPNSSLQTLTLFAKHLNKNDYEQFFQADEDLDANNENFAWYNSLKTADPAFHAKMFPLVQKEVGAVGAFYEELKINGFTAELAQREYDFFKEYDEKTFKERLIPNVLLLMPNFEQFTDMIAEFPTEFKDDEDGNKIQEDWNTIKGLYATTWDNLDVSSNLLNLVNLAQIPALSGQVAVDLGTPKGPKDQTKAVVASLKKTNLGNNLPKEFTDFLYNKAAGPERFDFISGAFRQILDQRAASLVVDKGEGASNDE